MTHDALVSGSGPAGLAAAHALAERGLGVAVVAPDPQAPWGPTWGAWADQVPPGLEPAVVAAFDRARVDLGEGRVHDLPRGYVRFDTPRLQALLTDRAVRAGVQLRAGRALHVEHGATESVVTTDRETLRALVVVDATGSGALLGGRPPTLFQTALGWVAELDRPLQGLSWMDFSFPHGDGTEAPTFLYGIPLPDGRTFVEETSLARVGGLPDGLLEARLRARLAGMGIRALRIGETERCRIALDRPIPRPGRTLGFGAAAAMVHPATGYQLTRALHAAAPFADSVVRG